jgi:hypothetical protein
MLLKVYPSFYISTVFDNANMAGKRTFCVRAKRFMLVDLCNVLIVYDVVECLAFRVQISVRIPTVVIQVVSSFSHSSRKIPVQQNLLQVTLRQISYTFFPSHD